MGSLTRALLLADAALRAAPHHVRRLPAYRVAQERLDALLDAADAAAAAGNTLAKAQRAGGATVARNAHSAELDAALTTAARALWVANGQCWRRGDSARIRDRANTRLYATDERIRRIKRAVERECT